MGLLNSEEEDALLEEGGQSVFDAYDDLELSEFPYEDLFKRHAGLWSD